MKKTMIVLSAAMCMFFAQAWAQTDATKVYVSASSNGTTLMTAEVLENYSFNVTLPPKEGFSVGGDVTAKLVLNDVLGVSGEKTLTKTLGEGQSIEGVSVTDNLSNCYGFAGASANVVVHNRTKSQAFTYTASGNGSVISGSTNETAAAAAWTILSEVIEQGGNTEGVFVEIKKGTYVQIGDEKLIFDDNLDLFKGDWRPNGITAALNQIIIDAKAVAHIETYSKLKEIETYVGVVYIPEGSKIGAGNHTATLTEPCKITLDLSNAHQENHRVSGEITKLVNKLDAEGKTKAVLESVNLFDQIVGMIDGAGTVDVDVRIGYLHGDVNKDGDVNVTDVTALVSMILGNSEKNDMADVNADGDVNVTDVTSLVSIILGH